MKKLVFAVCAASLIALSSCSIVSTGAGAGVLYTSVDEGSIATSNAVGKKVGISSATGVLGLVAVGDASIQSAASQAGIEKISHVDTKKTSILGLFATYQTIVYGE